MLFKLKKNIKNKKEEYVLNVGQYLNNIIFAPDNLKLKTIIVQNEPTERKIENIFGKKVRAGKRRTYFFDVVATKNRDYFLVITESKKRLDGNGFERHKIYLYKEDFNKFMKGLNETIDYIKTELMPDFNFEAFDYDDEGLSENEVIHESIEPVAEAPVAEEPKVIPDTTTNTGTSTNHEEVDKW